jgi:hypothetical protein
MVNKVDGCSERPSDEWFKMKMPGCTIIKGCGDWVQLNAHD